MGRDQDNASFYDVSELCSTIELVRMACSPDPLQRTRAWEQIVKRHDLGEDVFKRLSSWHYRDGLDPEMAHDLFQDMMIMAYGKLFEEPDMRSRAWLLDPTQTAGENRLVRWLMTCAKYMYYNERRQSQRDGQHKQEFDREAYHLPDKNDDPESALIRKQDAAAAKAIITPLLNEQLTGPHRKRLQEMLDMLVDSASGDDLNIAELARQNSQSRTVYYRTLRRAKAAVTNQPDSDDGSDDNG